MAADGETSWIDGRVGKAFNARVTPHMYIVNPLNKMRMSGNEKSSLFSSHPPLHERIERLQALMEEIRFDADETWLYVAETTAKRVSGQGSAATYSSGH